MKTVIIAEGEGIIALDIKQLLQRNNFYVSSTVYNSQDLIEQYKLQKPHLVIVHLHLEGKIPTQKVIKEIHNIDGTPIIIISSSEKEKLDKLFPSSPRLACITKPFDDKKLLEMVSNMTASIEITYQNLSLINYISS